MYISYNTEFFKLQGFTGFNASAVTRGAAAGLGGQLQALNTPFNPLYNSVSVSDPHGIMAAVEAIAAGAAETALSLPAGSYTMQSTAGTVARFQEINTFLIGAQASVAGGAGGNSVAAPYDAAGQLATGSTFLGFSTTHSLFAEYPEIETWGLSFNTNIGGHTVQGDFSYRPDMPIQIDTDVLAINSFFNGCAFTSVGAFEAAYQAGSTMAGERGNIVPLHGATLLAAAKAHTFKVGSKNMMCPVGTLAPRRYLRLLTRL